MCEAIKNGIFGFSCIVVVVGSLVNGIPPHHFPFFPSTAMSYPTTSVTSPCDHTMPSQVRTVCVGVRGVGMWVCCAVLVQTSDQSANPLHPPPLRFCRQQQLPFEYPHPLTPPQAPPPSGPRAIQVALSYGGATLRTETIVCPQAGCHVFASKWLILADSLG